MPNASLIIENAKVLTMDPDAPRAEAVAVAGNRLLAVGSAAEIVTLAGPETRRIDAKGATVLPGMTEAHLHIFPGAVGLRQLQLAGVQGLEALRAALSQYADDNPDAALLICKGADYNLFGAGIATTRQLLDQALADRPVILISGDHHTAWANTAAMEMAGILEGAETVIGTEVVMGEDGTATGELREFDAYMLVMRHRSTGGRENLGMTGNEPDIEVTPEQWEEDLETMRRGLTYCASFGFTSLHNMDGNLYQLKLLRELEQRGELICRIEIPYHMNQTAPIDSIDIASRMTAEFSSDRLRSGRVKMFMDGVIDSGTAVMVEDYADQPGWKGEPLHSAERFEAICVEADKRGLQISVHAIGDGAVRRVLDGYQAAREANGARDSRHRIEHIEVIHPDDIPRVKELGVVYSMQPSHPPGALDFPLTPWTLKVGEARWPYAFPVAALRDLGVPICFASDWPVADINPMRSVKAAMTRQPYKAGDPDNRIGLHEALSYYTAGGAYAGFDEDRLGSLKPGLLADIVVMDSDLEALGAAAVDRARAAMTICDGQIVWQASEG
ncbi:amidohydrolase [Pseudodonghicola flavimaris]|uniref:Amidohydrolase n=1 Tax=Pseudodonghicola flavimaris TaxID=3050036 RepID=A0ABT7F4Z6_9RHOB|nr:amidohydrolase [Pseudodonghicola flavimaris]MDK3019676.1 amidohydrolase [Pseudodonghicola flavimaris]